MEKNGVNLVKTDYLANLFGLEKRRIQQLAKQEVISPVKRNPYMFDLFPTIQQYIFYLSEKANGRESKKSGNAEMRKDEADARIKEAKAEIAEMQLQELKGEMHRSEDVENITTDLVFTIRSMILSLPGRLAMDIAQTKTAPEASAMIRKECEKILLELSNYKYDPETYKERVRERQGWSVPLDEDTEE